MSANTQNRNKFVIAGAVNGELITDQMASEHSITEMSQIEFYSDDTYSEVAKVTPTGGTVDVTLSPNGLHYRTVENGSFNAIDCYNETRTPPNALGLALFGKVVTAGIVGATHYKATFWRD